MYKLFLKKQNIQTTFKSSNSKGAKFKKSTLKKCKFFCIPENFSKKLSEEQKNFVLDFKDKNLF